MVWRFLSSVAGAFVRFYHLCERIGTAMGALKVMAVVIGGVLLVLAAIALVAALLLGYAIGSLGLAKVVLLILAVVLALAGVIFIIVGMRGRQAKTPVEETAKGQRFDVGGIQLEVIPPLEDRLRDFYRAGLALRREYCIDWGMHEAGQWHMDQTVTPTSPRGRLWFWFFDVRDFLDQTDHARALKPLRRAEPTWPRALSLFMPSDVCPQLEDDLAKLEELLKGGTQ